MADMTIIVRRNSTDIEFYMPRVNRVEGFLFVGEGVIDFDAHVIIMKFVGNGRFVMFSV